MIFDASIQNFCASLGELPSGVFLGTGPRFSVAGVPIQIASKSASLDEHSVIFFCFHGWLDQTKREIPFFDHAYSPALEFGKFVTVISVADPALRLDKKLSIAWYAGDHEVNTMQILANVVDKLRSMYPVTRFAFDGGSSGARAALLLSHRVPDSWCLVFNPLAFMATHEVDLKHYLAVCWPDRSDAFGTVVGDVVSTLYREGHSNWVLTLQNAFDKHFTRSILPFLSESFANSRRFLLLSNYYDGMLRHDFPWQDIKVWRRAVLMTQPATFEGIVHNATRALALNQIDAKPAPAVPDARDLVIARQLVAAVD